MKLGTFALLFSLFFPLQGFSNSSKGEELRKTLHQEFKRIDDSFPGDLGVAIEVVDTKDKIGYNIDKQWYLSSTTKVPIAIATLKFIEEGKLKLDTQVTLKQSDYVDGSGRINSEKPGAVYTIQDLISRMIQESDSTATDMLVRTVGVEKINNVIRSMGEGFGPITSILAVRYGAYSKLHPRAKNLTNMDFIDLKKSGAGQRPLAFAKKAKIKKSQLQEKGLEQAFEKYYLEGENSAHLYGFANLLAKLERRELLNEPHTALLLKEMEQVKTGKKRIQAGLGPNYIFKQKTGTQVDRICNVGIVERKETKKNITVAACTANFPSSASAENALKQVGEVLKRSEALFN